MPSALATACDSMMMVQMSLDYRTPEVVSKIAAFPRAAKAEFDDHF
jgi:hypothetical protein